MMNREYSSLNQRARAIAGAVVFPRSKESSYERRASAPAPYGAGEHDWHGMGITPELFYQSDECRAGKDECMLAMRASNSPYVICFNSNQGPVLHSGGGAFAPENPWEFCLHPLTTGAVLVSPGSTARSLCLVVGQQLMRELGTDIGLPEAGPMPRSTPQPGEPWVLWHRVLRER